MPCPTLLSLPSEMISLILTYLPLPTLAQVSLVCHHLSRLAGDPLLWASLHLVLPRDPDEAVLALDCSRLQKVARLSLVRLEGEGGRRVLRHITTCWTSCSLKRLDLTNIDLSEVPVKELVELVSKLEEVEMENTTMTVEQIRQLFMRLTQHTTELKSLNIGDQKNMKEVPSHILGEAVNKLKKVVLPDDRLSDEQLTSIFLVMKKRTCLKSLQLMLHKTLPSTPNSQLCQCCDILFRLRARLGRLMMETSLVMESSLKSPVISQTCVARMEETEVRLDYTWKEEVISFLEVYTLLYNTIMRYREKKCMYGFGWWRAQRRLEEITGSS